ncbi:transcriptional regulator medA [Aspergillus clavatus NRRL 1]|uniref:Transcriptional regulator Medusa n=1 Tax=Aspergillus clavatus (strain ATCC 1007 / CBS 513.65 / DSM 816 / NCTC 3887 / NRRL 1 / QM 1276 / 107) TaxID=344612 RepID=A1C702_ASPCL|nr:transcriptional regulator Medusa [Aspergillus clavatus NRRL 1]EAW14173.1 transcriptional regulator Medusa [Aspergillus clavatus NRRL 1]
MSPRLLSLFAPSLLLNSLRLPGRAADESLDFSDPEESRFAGVFSDGLLAKSDPILSMSTFQKPPTATLLDYESTRSLHDGPSYSNYGQNTYVTNTPLVPSPMADQASQISDCGPYLPNQEYASSYEEGRSPMMSGEPRQLPEVISYTPQRGSEGTRVFVQIQSTHDLHSSAYTTLHLVFGSKKCECTPHFLGLQGPSFQYALSADTPPFLSTGSPSFAVPLQITIESTHSGGPATTTLQVGVYTYEHASQHSPTDETRKRRVPSFSKDAAYRPIKRAPAAPAHTSYEDGRSTSYSPYLQPLPAMSGYMPPYHHPTSSPRVASSQYSAVSTPHSSIRAPSPLTPSWTPSLVNVSSDARNPNYAIAHGYRQHKSSSPARPANPTLIRTSTLQQANGLGHAQSFNPYAMYPSKAVLKLNGDLDTMTEKWTPEERETKRRLVQFNRIQNGSTIHADFKPVAPEERGPNSICISCIYWEGKDECFVTSVDTIYLLESLVGVRFTVEEKNRIRRNLEGFRPLTVSKAKADSEDFFKVIMGFPAPKPRNIEKDVKVFPWKILSHALKKIIGKYSASYSSTAGALPTPMASNYPGNGAPSDSGTEPYNAASPQSVSDAAPPSTYCHSIATPAYSPPTDSSGPELRAVLPAVSQPYHSMAPGYSYPAVCQQQSHVPLAAPVSRPSWELGSLAHHPSASAGHSGNGSCYNYMAPMPYSLPDPAHGS